MGKDPKPALTLMAWSKTIVSDAAVPCGSRGGVPRRVGGSWGVLPLCQGCPSTVPE